MRKFQSRFRVESEIPTSSMADIAFLLIVFFMVTSVFAARKGMQMALPTDENTETEVTNSTEHAIYVKIYADGRFNCDRVFMDLPQIRSYIQEKVDVNPKKFVLIHPADDAPFEYIIDILDEVRQTNATNISIPTRREIAAWGNIPGLDTSFND